MDHRTVVLQNELRAHLREEVPRVISNRYFAEIDFRPKFSADLLKATTLHFLTYSEVSDELRFVNDVFTNAELVVATPHFEDDPSSPEWIDRIVTFSVRAEFPDVDPTHDDVVLWERYRRDGHRTGRLKAADESIIEDDVNPVPAIQRAIEYGLQEVLPQHEGRSEESGLPLEFVRNATPDDWERIGEMGPNS